MSAGKQFHFLRQSPWRHNLLNLTCFATVLALLGLTAAASQWLPAAIYLPLASLGFGIGIFALLILVVHEASHGMFIIGGDSARRQFWNRCFGWLVAVPTGIHYVRQWEVGHIIHHVSPLTAEDPQAFNRTTGPELWRLLVLSILVPGYGFVRRLRRKRTVASGRAGSGVLLVFVGFWLVTMAACGLRFGWTVPVALFLGQQVTLVLNEIKGALEHGGEIAFDPDPLLRSRTTFFPLRLIVLPWHISLHFEHHLSMCVPWYRLMAYHRAVLPHVPPDLRPWIFNRNPVAQLQGRIGAVPVSTDQAFADPETSAVPG
jgi:fatty acid desaturase